MKSIEQVKTAVAENISKFKEAENMTFDDLGEISGLNRHSIVNWAYQHKLPNLYSAYLLADAMGLSLQELIE